MDSLGSVSCYGVTKLMFLLSLAAGTLTFAIEKYIEPKVKLCFLAVISFGSSLLQMTAAHSGDISLLVPSHAKDEEDAHWTTVSSAYKRGHHSA